MIVGVELVEEAAGGEAFFSFRLLAMPGNGKSDDDSAEHSQHQFVVESLLVVFERKDVVASAFKDERPGCFILSVGCVKDDGFSRHVHFLQKLTGGRDLPSLRSALAGCLRQATGGCTKSL